MEIGFIGFGNMAAAIAAGVLDGGLLDASQLIAYNPHGDKVTAFGRGITAAASAAEVAQTAKYVFLCFKPQSLDAAAVPLRGQLRDDAVLVSILAGASCARIKQALETDRPVVRVMPNTPLMLGKGCSAVARPNDVDDADFDYVLSIFSAAGYAFETTEARINEIIPVNGSSPAAIYLFAKLFADNAARMGVEHDLALRAFAHTLIGSAEMILNSGKDVDTLIQMVCSKGGTTLAMLDAFRENGFENAVCRGIEACVERARELGK